MHFDLIAAFALQTQFYTWKPYSTFKYQIKVFTNEIQPLEIYLLCFINEIQQIRRFDFGNLIIS